MILSASIQYPNKLFVKIDVDPSSSTELIDHFEFYVDDVAQKAHLKATDVKFSAEGFAGGEQYEIYILAYPKFTLPDVQPIPSNKRVRREKRIRSMESVRRLLRSNERSKVELHCSVWPCPTINRRSF